MTVAAAGSPDSTGAPEAPSAWVALARDVADGLVSPWAAAPALGSYDDAALLALPEAEAAAVVDLCRRLAAAVEAAQLLGVEAVARRDDEAVEAQEEQWERDRLARGGNGQGPSMRGALSAAEWTRATLLPVLRLSPTATESVIEDARVLVGSLPETFALVRAGRLSAYHARLVATQARCIDLDKRGELDAVLVHPELGRRRYRNRLPELTSPALRARVAQVATDVDPDWVRRHVRTARENRHVRVRAGLEPGVSSWSASLPSEDSLAMWAAIDALADELLRADETAAASLLAAADDRGQEEDDGTRPRRRGIEAARADALVALVLGQATVTTTVDLTVPLTDWPSAASDAAPDADAMSTPHEQGEADDPSDADLADEAPPGESSESGRADTTGGADDLDDVLVGPSTLEQALSDHLSSGIGDRLREWLRGEDEEVVDGVHIVRARRHLQLVVDLPDSPSAGPPDPSPPPEPGPTPSLPSPPSVPSSVLPWVVGVEHPHVGVLLPEAVLRLLADPDTRLRLHGCHPDTGAPTTHDPTTHDPTTYRPGAALARAVRARDGHCRFPGCTVDASRCQLDHVTPFPGGPTTAANLAALCTRHHRLKTHTPWRYVLHDDGTCTWTSPLGYHYDTHPDRPTDRAA